MKAKTVKTPLNNKQLEKVKSDLNILRILLRFSKKAGFRAVVSGGYGLDGVLGEITRPHNDLDVILYGKVDRKEAIKILHTFITSLLPSATMTIRENPFNVAGEINAKGFGAALYFVETINDPFEDIKTIKRADGKTQVNAEDRFPLPVRATLLGVQFEAQNPNLHLADILYKRKKEKKLPKHAQDIKNLKQITDEAAVNAILSQYED